MEIVENNELPKSKPVPDIELKELSRISWSEDVYNQNYLKGCLWSPDGHHLLTAVNGQGLKLIEIPEDLVTEPGRKHFQIQIIFKFSRIITYSYF